MSKLLLAEVFQVTYEQLTRQLPQGCLLVGAAGMNLREIADTLATAHAKSNVTTIEPQISKAGVKSISIEQIRDLYAATRSKTGQQVVVLHDIHTASQPAQNAFLKLLEEPREQLNFILTTSQQSVLLPTIRSRVQAYRVPPISREQSDELLQKHDVSDAVTRQKLLFLAAGLPEKLTELATWPKAQQDALQMAADAKTALTADAYTAMMTLVRYHADRQKAQTVLATMIAMLRAGAVQPTTTTKIERYLEALDALRANVNTRLVLAHVVV